MGQIPIIEDTAHYLLHRRIDRWVNEANSGISARRIIDLAKGNYNSKMWKHFQ